MEALIEADSIRIPGYYDITEHIEKEYKDGLYGVVPNCPVVDFRRQKTFSHVMEWAYNNGGQPFADIDYKGYAIGYIDGSRANAVKTIGSMKSIWKDFERMYMHKADFDNIRIDIIEDNFWNYYISNYKENFEAGVKVFEDYVKSKRCYVGEETRALEEKHFPIFAYDDTWIKGCRDYLKHLIRKSTRGFMMEVILYTALEKLTGGSVIESSVKDERKGIDFYISINDTKYPVSLKPSTFRYGISPVYQDCLVKYNKHENDGDLIFTFYSGKELLDIARKNN